MGGTRLTAVAFNGQGLPARCLPAYHHPSDTQNKPSSVRRDRGHRRGSVRVSGQQGPRVPLSRSTQPLCSAGARGRGRSDRCRAPPGPAPPATSPSALNPAVVLLLRAGCAVAFAGPAAGRGEELFVAFADGTVRVFSTRAPGRASLATLKGHKMPVSSIDVHPTGTASAACICNRPARAQCVVFTRLCLEDAVSSLLPPPPDPFPMPVHVVLIAASACRAGERMLTTSHDAVTLWDLRGLKRLRVLRCGPYGCRHAQFVVGGGASRVATLLGEDAFWFWDATTFAVTHKIALPRKLHPRLSASMFDVSKDGRWLVAVGQSPIVYTWDVPSGELLFELQLPSAVAKATNVRFVQTGEGPTSGTVICVCCDDGVMRFIDLNQGAVLLSARGTSFSSDLDGQHSISITSDASCLALHDLSAALLDSKHVEYLTKLRAGRRLGLNADSNLHGHAHAEKMSQTSPAATAPEDADLSSDGHAYPHGRSEKDTLPRSGDAGLPKAEESRPRNTVDGQRIRVAERKDGNGQSTAEERINYGAVSRLRLRNLLASYGEFPSKYRSIAWTQLLELPDKQASFAALAALGPHLNFVGIEQTIPIKSHTLLTKTKSVLSALGHWCPVLAEAPFLPAFAFPFIAFLGTSTECQCFEMMATLLLNWGRQWLEAFPAPPLQPLGQIEVLLGHHDSELMQSLARAHAGPQAYAWPLLSTAFSETFARKEWVKLWDHILANDSSFIQFVVVSYLVNLRTNLVELGDPDAVTKHVRAPQELAVNDVIRRAYELRASTPTELLTPLQPFQSLGKSGPSYPSFENFPQMVLAVQKQQRERIAAQEDAIHRRRLVVATLSRRTKQLEAKESMWQQEQERMAADHKDQRQMMMRIEQQRVEEELRLADQEKEERLRQIAIIEHSYQENLERQRRLWEDELAQLQSETEAAAKMTETMVQSRLESEAIKTLEFDAQQRLILLEEDRAREAALKRMRLATKTFKAKMEGDLIQKEAAWAQQAEEQKLRLASEKARQAKLAQVEEELRAQSELTLAQLRAQVELDQRLASMQKEYHSKMMQDEELEVTLEVSDAKGQREQILGATDSRFVGDRLDENQRWIEDQNQQHAQRIEEGKALYLKEKIERELQLEAIERQRIREDLDLELKSLSIENGQESSLKERNMEQVKRLDVDLAKDHQLQADVEQRPDIENVKHQHQEGQAEERDKVTAEERSRFDESHMALRERHVNLEEYALQLPGELLENSKRVREEGYNELGSDWQEQVQKEALLNLQETRTHVGQKEELKALNSTQEKHLLDSIQELETEDIPVSRPISEPGTGLAAGANLLSLQAGLIRMEEKHDSAGSTQTNDEVANARTEGRTPLATSVISSAGCPPCN
eukprot:scaffold1009_cov375-Prasinococcus_capsulatus_cf.AAC.5